MASDFDLSGEFALLTGGAGILGAVFAAALVRHGARVAIVDRDGARLEEVAAKVKGLSAHQVDITDAQALRRLQGKIDVPTILVNNAAAKSANFFAPFEEFPLRDWEEVMDVNPGGAMLCAQIFGAAMA